MKKITIKKFGLSLVTVFTLLNQPLYAEPVIPVYEEPRHQLAYENAHVRILNVNLPPGYVSLYHQHQLDMLYVTLNGSKVWAEPLGGNKRYADVQTGNLRFSSDNHDLPHIHRVGNVGKTPFHLIGIAIKDQTSEHKQPITGDMQGIDLAIEKPHGHVYRITLQPGKKTGLHTHQLPFVSVNLSSGTLIDQKGQIKTVGAGEYQWHDKGLTHYYENGGDEAIEIIELQWR